MAEWPTLGALGEPTDVIVAPPRNPARAPQGLEDAIYGMTVKPLSDIGMGIGSVVEGQGWNSPEANAGFLAAMGLLTPMRTGALRPGIKAYHGSPHDFDRFDISKIGTGEGAQAYGHGLYFAENPKTAQSYRDALTNPGAVVSYGSRTPGIFLEGKPFDPRNQRIIDIIQKAEGDPSRFVPELTKYAREGAGNPYSAADDAMAIVDAANRGQYSNGLPGRMYEVSINAKPEQFLDWDRPLSGQSPEVQSFIANRASLLTPEIIGPRRGGKHILQTMVEQDAPGADLYGRLAYKPGAFPEIAVSDRAAASAALRDAGIPGIRYLDQGSRGHGTGTSNYVLFRDDIIDILRKYGIMAPASGVALDQATQRQ